MLMKPTVCYGACDYLSFPYPTSQAEMNQSPVSLRPFFQEFQVLLLRLSDGFRGAPLDAGIPRSVHCPAGSPGSRYVEELIGENP